MKLEEKNIMTDCTQLEESLIRDLEDRIGDNYMLFLQNPADAHQISAIVGNSKNIDLLQSAYISSMHAAIQLVSETKSIAALKMFLLSAIAECLKHCRESFHAGNVSWETLLKEFEFILDKHLATNCDCPKCTPEKKH